MKSKSWTNPSVLAFAGDRDPISVVEEAARSMVLRAREQGWSGPPFNPVELAPLFGAKLRPNSSLLDARVIVEQGETVIEYNPQQARERIRFSIAHELAHILFPDYHVEARNRAHTSLGHEWQLEMLCNIAASEFVLPTGSLPANLGNMSIEDLMIERRSFDVSTEAFLIRAAKVSDKPITMFVAAPEVNNDSRRKYSIEYSISSPTAYELKLRGTIIPDDSIIQQCTAIGYTQSEIASWATGNGELIEYVGIPGFPGERYPRVAGIIRHDAAQPNRGPIKYRHGNILDLAGSGKKVIAQLVNDRAVRWGGGIAKRFADQFPTAEAEFTSSIMQIPAKHRLGSVVFTKLDEERCLASIVAQEGYGPSLFPRIRYSALEVGLREVAAVARNTGASVHLPKIGTGAAGADWGVVEELIDNEFIRSGLDVTVYELPPKRQQLQLF